MGLDRRSFLKLIAGAGAGILVTPVPWKLLDDVSKWTQNWSWIPRLQPGKNTFVQAVSKTCPSNVSIKVRLVDGRPVRVLPNPGHPLGGGVTALALTEVQMLNSPSRVTSPLLRENGKLKRIEWSEAAQILHDKLKKARSSVTMISGDETGTTTEVMSAFTSALGSKNMFLMPSEGQSAAIACNSLGIKAQLGYDIEQSDYILAIGANILESWGPVVATRRAFFNTQKSTKEKTAVEKTLVYAGSIQNNTAAASQLWLASQPNTEGALALCLANELIQLGYSAPIDDFSTFKSVCSKFSIEKTSSITGIPSDTIKTVIDGLKKAKRPLVIVGSSGIQSLGAAPLIAGFAINALLGNINKVGGVSLNPIPAVALEGANDRFSLHQRDLCKWFSEKETPEVLIINEANPAFALPDSDAVKERINAIPFKVSFAYTMDETSELCDLVLPIGMGLERIDDVSSPYGLPYSIYCGTTPVVTSNENLRDVATVLLFIAKQMGKNLGFDTYEEVLRSKANVMNGNFDLVMQGEPIINKNKVPFSSFTTNSNMLEQAVSDTPLEGIRLVVNTKLSMGTATTGIPPFNTKTIKENELVGKEMCFSMNANTASKLGIIANQRIKVSSDNDKKIFGLVSISEGVAPETVVATFGFGHTAFDEFSQNKGFNVMNLLKAQKEPITGASVWSTAQVKVTKA